MLDDDELRKGVPWFDTCWTEGKMTNLSQIIQYLRINTIFLKSGLTVLDHIVHDALVHRTL